MVLERQAADVQREPLSPASHDKACLELVHLLNQRYRAEWERAEAYRAELADIKSSRAWRLLQWLRSIRRRWFAKKASTQTSAAANAAKVAGPIRDLSNFRRTARGSVSIIVPFRDQHALLANLLRSLRKTAFRRFEVILVDNDSSCPKVARLLERLTGRKRIRVVRAPGPFNFSRNCNLGAQASRGEFLLFLNNDIEVVNSDWLERMLELANDDRIGVVGATLLYPDGTLQHAGISPTEQGSWSHLHRHRPGDYLGEVGELAVPREVPAVTGACLMTRRRLFATIGGFSESFPITGNDVDLCLRAKQAGLITAISPHARLVHWESLSRGYSRD